MYIKITNHSDEVYEYFDIKKIETIQESYDGDTWETVNLTNKNGISVGWFKMDIKMIEVIV